jgi:HK97 family phage portal protein
LFSNPPKWLTSWINGWEWGDERDERGLSSESAISYAPIWYGVNKISGHIGQLPINVYKRMDRGAERVRDHRIARLMRRPNKFQSSIVFREQMSMNSLLDGNGIAAICREGNVIKELIPLYPSLSATFMLQGEKVHATRPPKDDRLRLYFESSDVVKSEDGVIQLQDIDVIHIPGLSLNGVSGVPLRKIAARNIGASIDAEKRLANQMKNGFSGNLMLQAPPGVFRNEKDAAEFIQHFEERHNAPDKAGKPGLLREGITANMLAMNNKDAEMIDNRLFQRQDAALYLGLESILGDDTSVSYNSLEQKNLAYLMNCLNRWLRRWEEELEYKLLPDRQYDSESHFVKFNTAALLKSDFEATVAALGSLVTTTIFSRNEAREKLDLNPVEGGDVYENPAITPGQDKSDNPPANDPPEKKTNDARKAINAHIGNMLGVEANRCLNAAKTVNNFIEWMDNFYSKNFEHVLADNLEAVGIDRNEATKHCEESKRLLLDVCGASSVDNFVQNVSDCVSTWKSRVHKIGAKDV